MTVMSFSAPRLYIMRINCFYVLMKLLFEKVQLFLDNCFAYSKGIIQVCT